MTQESICGQIAAGFEAGAYQQQCRNEISTAIRISRGLVHQHDAAYAEAVTAMESKLAVGSFLARDFDTTL
jgi:hypothetical protein